MQTLALLLLLAVTVSLIAPFESVLAQSEEEMIDEEMTDEGTMEDTSEGEMTDDQAMEETMEGETEDEMAETMEEETEEHIDSPLKQMAMGIDPHEIQCKAGQILVFKAGNFKPACVNESSIPLLQARGWASDHDPTHEELAPMMDEFMPSEESDQMTEEEMTDEEMTGDMSEDEMMDDGMEESTEETDAEIQPQSYVIELSEDMQLGTQ